jgi:death on curing protein
MIGVEPIWIEPPELLALHERLLALHGGAPGVREEGLLHSALARPRQRASYVENADVVDLAVAYTSGVVRNHPFVDGNKRTGFLIGILFLELNGYRFTAPETTTTNAVLALAAGTLDEVGYTAFLRANVEPE